MDEAVFQHRLSIPRKAMEALAVRPILKLKGRVAFAARARGTFV